jgi:hypothetical protein
MRLANGTEISSCASHLFPERVTSADPDSGIAPSRWLCWRRAQRRQCSSLRFDPAGGRAFGH